MSSFPTVVLLLNFALPVVLVVGGLVALYWIIRRAVRAGIRDARADGDGGAGRS